MKQGFTLLELSIVLVIIGLIIGGITVGADMIRSAELNSVVSDINKYKTVVNTFRLKYNALPGDMKNATAYWGIAGGTGSDNTCFDTTSTNIQTCNGNGDGKISGTGFNEPFRAWQHMANAELLSGSFTGRGTNGNASSGNQYGYEAGINAPSSKISSATWQLAYRSEGSTGNGTYYPYTAGNLLLFGMESAGANVTVPVLTTQDMQTIDTKIDDGKPAFGSIKTFKKDATAGWAGQVGGCANDTNAAIAEYDVSASGALCVPMIKAGF